MNEMRDEAVEALRSIMKDRTIDAHTRAKAAEQLLALYPEEEEEKKATIYVVGGRGQNKMLSAFAKALSIDADIIVMDDIVDEPEGLGTCIHEMMEQVIKCAPCEDCGPLPKETDALQTLLYLLMSPMVGEAPEKESCKDNKAKERDTPKEDAKRARLIKEGRLYKHFLGGEFAILDHVLGEPKEGKPPVVEYLMIKNLDGESSAVKFSCLEFYGEAKHKGKSVPRFEQIKPEPEWVDPIVTLGDCFNYNDSVYMLVCCGKYEMSFVLVDGPNRIGSRMQDSKIIKAEELPSFRRKLSELVGVEVAKQMKPVKVQVDVEAKA